MVSAASRSSASPGSSGRAISSSNWPSAWELVRRCDKAECGEAALLAGAGVSDPGGDLGAALARGGKGEVGDLDRGQLDLQVDAVDQRARNAGLVFRRAAGPAPAHMARLAGEPHLHGFMAATSWKRAG
jgi:hypothetical protein